MVAPLDLDALSKPTHDAQCETELTSHGYTPCRCEERAAVTAQRAAPHHLTAEDLRAAATACDCQGNIHDRQQLEEGQVTMPTRGREWHELSLKFMKASDAVRAAAPAEGAGLDGADLDDLRWAVNQAFANSPITRERLPARFVQGVPPKSE